MTSTEKAKSGSIVSKITYRLATPKDYNAVMDINRYIYNGFDYLPALYMKFMRDPNYRITVAEIDRELVAMAGGYVIDNGKTVVGIAARVKTTHLDKGVWGKMRTRSDKDQEEDPAYADVDTFAARTTRWDLHKMFWRKGKDYKLRMVQSWYTLIIDTKAVLPCTPKVLNGDRVSEIISPHDILLILEDKDNQWRLFPQGKIVFDGIPFSLRTVNFQTICKTAVKCVITRQLSAAERQCQSLSVANVYPVAKGTYYSLDFYGKDLDDLYNHVCIHLCDMERHRVHGELYVLLALPSGFVPSDVIEKVINRIACMKVSGEPVSWYFMDLPWSQL